MPKTKRTDPTELLRLALIGFDAQIAELQKIRAQLAALIDQPSAGPAVQRQRHNSGVSSRPRREQKSAPPQKHAGKEREKQRLKRRKRRLRKRNQRPSLQK